MPRPKGSKIFSCPKCTERVVALPGEYGTCKACGTRTKLTKILLAAQTPIARSASEPQKVQKGKPAPAPVTQKRGRQPAAQVEAVEEPERRGRKPVAQVEAVEEPKRRGRPPLSKLDVAEEPPKRSRKPTTQAVEVDEAPKRRGRPPMQKAALAVQSPKGTIRPPKRAYN
jgi:hypothetical protein